MTLFLDVRLNPVGGELAKTVCIYGLSAAGYETYPIDKLRAAVSGRQVLIATHGFNVSRKDGYESLSAWGDLLQLDPMTVFLGLLWPGIPPGRMGSITGSNLRWPTRQVV